MQHTHPLERFFTLIAPHNCLICGREGSFVCNACRNTACPPLHNRCYRCLVPNRTSRVCESCARNSKLMHVWAYTRYEATAKDLLRSLKFERAKGVADVLVDYLDQKLPTIKNAIITHVPAASSRMRVRGYDQAKLLAQELAARRGLVHQTLLARQGQARQLGARRDVRLKQLKGTFRALHRADIDEQRIILIDDVLTTGGTLEATALVLKQAGARQVDALVFAHKQ